jgi:hypothetical protein
MNYQPKIFYTKIKTRKKCPKTYHAWNLSKIASWYNENGPAWSVNYTLAGYHPAKINLITLYNFTIFHI